jgi:hypothetical protein
MASAGAVGTLEGAPWIAGAMPAPAESELDGSFEDAENENRGNRMGNAGAVDKLAARKASARRSVRGGKTQGLSRSPVGARAKTPPPPKTRAVREELSAEEADAVACPSLPHSPGSDISLSSSLSSSSSSGSPVSRPVSRVLQAVSMVLPSSRVHEAPRSPSWSGAVSATAAPLPSAMSAAQPSARRSAVLLMLAEALVLVLCLLFVSPSHEAPRSSNKAFFHTVEQGQPFSFEIEVSAWPQPEFQWRLNGVDIVGMTEKKLVVGSARLAHSGTYTCVVENKAGRLVWEEGYVNVLPSIAAGSAGASAGASLQGTGAAAGPSPNALAVAASSLNGDSERVRSARMCLLKRAPAPVLRSASADGGAAVIAAGESAGYLDCFEGLKAQEAREAAAAAANGSDGKGGRSSEMTTRRVRALGLLRSMHGSSGQRNLLVNVVSALDDLALLTLTGSAPDQAVSDAKGRVVFEAGLFCASTPQCQGDTTGNARQRVVSLVMHALGSSSDL